MQATAGEPGRRLRCKRAAPGPSAVCTWQLASSSCGSEGGKCRLAVGHGSEGLQGPHRDSASPVTAFKILPTTF